jgi:hypothetical protein
LIAPLLGMFDALADAGAAKQNAGSSREKVRPPVRSAVHA